MQERPRAFAGALREEGLSPALQVLALLVVVLLIFSRRPGDLFHAQFYAEDGKRWFQQAYNLGWLPSLLVPDAGYLHLLARVFVGPALLLPLRWAPLWFNLCGAVLQAMPIVVLLSHRCAPWGSLRVRFAMAILYLAGPNAAEVHLVLTNSQWHFAVLQALLAFARPPQTRLGKALDIAIFLMGALSGPFDLVLLPILLLAWWKQRQPWTLVILACLAFGAVFQVDTLLTGTPFGLAQPGAADSSRATVSHMPLGASTRLFTQIVGDDVFLDSLTGYLNPERLPMVVPVIFLLLGSFIVACGMRWGPPAIRYFGLFALALFAVSLKSPLIVDPVSRWHAMAVDGGMRYYFYPMLVFLWSGVYAWSNSPNRYVKATCAGLLLLFLTGLRHWEYPRFADHQFAAYTANFERAQPGETVVFPIQPNPWTMTLIKH